MDRKILNTNLNVLRVCRLVGSGCFGYAAARGSWVVFAVAVGVIVWSMSYVVGSIAAVMLERSDASEGTPL